MTTSLNASGQKIIPSGNPGPMKSVWDLVGVQAPHLLAPLVNCNPDTSARLRSELQARLVPEAQLG